MMTTLLESKPLFLLCSLIILLLVSPFIEATQWGDFLITLTFTGILLALVHLVSDQRNIQIGVGLVAGCAVLLLWIGDAFPANAAWLWGEALYVCLNIFVICLALTQIIRSSVVDRDVLIGAVAIYLLLGLTWALIFSFVHSMDPSSFGDILGSEHGDWNQFVYFSFSTLTTLGYGDIVALSPFARTLSVLTAVTGVMYEAMIIARLVGLFRGAQGQPESDTPR